MRCDGRIRGPYLLVHTHNVLCLEDEKHFLVKIIATGPELVRTGGCGCPPLSLKVHFTNLADSVQPENKMHPKNSSSGHDCQPFSTDDYEKREWMGIEPTRPLFSSITGFEAQ